jgi:hypothetical protein
MRLGAAVLIPLLLGIAACQIRPAAPRAPDPSAKVAVPIAQSEPAAAPAPVVPPLAHPITPVTDAAATPTPATPQPPVAPIKKPVASPLAPKVPAAAPASVAPPAAVAAPTAKPLPAAALDLAGLEQRLKDTRAIGVFTKLSLKNQVDDLLKQFRMFYSGQAKASLAELRQRYDLLLLKVLSLLQDADPPLAAAISSSKEALWGILSDKEKFNKIESG